ncbi:MAG: bifunctional pyr operon transcriptional regulator/uracil phosphoribosyltransferase PyrR [Gammaproteobacteria bacterium]|jgi:pyrimidine operon attenuation protein/uracil phosphoribosyltransferase|nr:bifunctional pyr operon transcriptional regulator/uracil phosphoribosyltransferase PyrR [Gammaproteobacteria bacterium]
MSIEVGPLLDDITAQLNETIVATGRESPVVVGIRTGGVWVAQHLHKGIASDSPLGALNIAFYRDDFSRIGMHPTVEPSKLPFDVNDRHLVLVDDILYTGRTIRAAMNEIFDYGRPASILLVVLIERSGRELPIQADVVGTRLNLEATEHVKLIGPDPLHLELCKAKP